MEYSDDENDVGGGDLIDDILGPEDLFNDEADERDDEEDINQASDAEDKPDKTNLDATEKTEKKVKPKRVVKNPRVTLTFDTLRGPNGLSVLKKLFGNFQFKGTNHEKEDLTKIIGILQQWMCYRLCPSYDFESVMLQLENLGKKKVVQTLMKKYRMGMDDWGENKSDDDNIGSQDNNMEINEENSNKENDMFDLLLNEDVGNLDSEDELIQNGTFSTQNVNCNSQVSQNEIVLTPEQIERIARNRKMAEERRLKRLNTQQENMEVVDECKNGESEISLETINLDGKS